MTPDETQVPRQPEQDAQLDDEQLEGVDGGVLSTPLPTAPSGPSTNSGSPGICC
jgi:hypothetical protein